MRIVRQGFFVFCALAAAIAGLGAWVMARALPVTDGTVAVQGLAQPVTVDRDRWGIPHIRAASLEDMVEAQGYVTAQDRLWQMDVLRRLGSGELSEVFGKGTLELDERIRKLGLRQAAARDASLLDDDSRAVLEAYARGVNRFIEQHRSKMPVEFLALRYSPTPWTPADTMVILGYMYQSLTTTWVKEINRDVVNLTVAPDIAADLFAEDSPYDHVVVGSTETPADDSSKTSPHPDKPAAALRIHPESAAASPLPLLTIADVWDQTRGLLASFSDESRASIGSNNWVVDGKHTASGKPLLANDTHLDLTVPSIWYIVHLTAPGWNVKGFALPGAPLVAIGHNDRIAWGFTNTGADVQDLYLERFSEDNPQDYLVNGRFLPASVRTERIKVRGESDALMDVYTTRHGPIVQRTSGRAYALQWTALEAGALAHGFMWMGRARNWQEFRETLRDVSGPAQNVGYADVDGNIGFIMAGWIPIRKTGKGEGPVPGDTDEYEWTGHIPFDELPQVFNPPGGVIVTANARIVGPGYKHYITDRWDAPYRTERIYDLLTSAAPGSLRPADMNTMQNDVVALNDKYLAASLVHAAAVTKPKNERAATMIARLDHWGGQAQASSAETTFVQVTRDVVLRTLLEPFLSAGTDVYQWRGSVFVDTILRTRPAKWLPHGVHDYDELLVSSAGQAAELIEARTHSKDFSEWRIGALNTLIMNHPLGQSGIAQRLLSIGPLEQSGNVYAPKAMTRTHGPAMRFVADLSDWDQSMMEVNSGQSGEFGSSHYRDQFTEWFAGRAIASPFTDAAEGRTVAHRMTLAPQ